MYLEFLIQNRRISHVRKTVYAALRALPVTQHERIWDLVINRFLASREFDVPAKTCKRLLERYLQYEPGYVDSAASLLIEKGDLSGSVELLIKRIEDSGEESSSRLLLLIELISKNSNKLKELENIDLPSIIRTGLQKYPSKLGELWNSLSDYYIRLGLFSKAVDVYEEAMESVQTVLDFSLVFESYQSFLELIVQTKLGSGKDPESAELDLQRLELLVERRADLLSSVVLRQNPHNVIEWTKRAKLPRIILGGSKSIVSVYFQALETVDVNSPRLVGRVSSLWIEFARHYYSENDLESARKVFERAILSEYKSLDDLASVWTEFILMELRLSVFSDAGYDRVLEIARRAISQYRGAAKGSVQSQLYRSVKLWTLALDVEESFNGDSKPALVRSIYDSMMELKVITPQAILNYSQFELDRKCFEKAIQVLEKGISLFSWPHCRDMWLFYISLVEKEKKRFSTERVRDLFDQVLRNCESKFAPIFYCLAFKFELDRGLASDAISVLNRATLNVAIQAKMGFYLMAISQCMKVHGAAATRCIFEQAISAFSSESTLEADRNSIEMCIEYCWMEAKLGQTSRARKLLEHASQFANPEKPEMEFFWDVWKNFEIENGSEDTYKDMKRVRRAVQIKYSDKHFNTLDVGLGLASDASLQQDEAVMITATSMEAGPQGIDVSKLKRMAALKKTQVL